MDAHPTLIHIDHPTSFPLGKTFLVRGWVVSDRPIQSVHAGDKDSPPLTLEPRPDVSSAHPDHAFATGFSGQLSTADLRDDHLRLLCRIQGETVEFETGLKRHEVPPDKRARLERIRPHLRDDLPFEETPFHFNFVTDELRKQFGVFDTENVSDFEYTPKARAIIDQYKSGLVLDCGAGLKKNLLPNVVNLEIVPYVSTDVIAVAEQLPFKENSFDAVISCAVLEHLKDPFLAAREMVRVTKPGGIIQADVPFLQPYHGYPAHYYNMTSQGLVNLFSDQCEIRETSVPEYGTPIWTLSWFLNSYLAGLPPETREEFRKMRVDELLDKAVNYRDKNFVRELSEKANFELACTTSVTAVVRKG